MRSRRNLPRPLQGVYRRKRRPSLGDAYQKAMDKANEANEQRYQSILGGYDDLHSRVMADLVGVGDADKADINRRFDQQKSDSYQRLVNRGLGNSTIPASIGTSIERERSNAQSRLSSQLARERASADTGITTGKLGVMERRTDAQPDVNQMIALSRALGQGGYGGSGVGRPIGISPAAYQQAYMRSLGQMFPVGGVNHWNSVKNRLASSNDRRRRRYRNTPGRMSKMPGVLGVGDFNLMKGVENIA